MKNTALIIAGALILGGVSFWYTKPAWLSALPGAPTSLSSQTVNVKIGESKSALGVTITPTSVLEDSRCPADVTCVWAGRVRLTATVASGLGTSEFTFGVGGSMTTEAETITLMSVSPAKISTGEIAASQYEFTFKIEKR